MTDFSGMTVNERLVLSGQMKAWDKAVATSDRGRMIGILVATAMTEPQAQETVAAVLADPARYGYKVRP
jgi:hypothetical protein